MFRKKITFKLFLIVASSMILLVGLVIMVQFFIVSRTYLTTEYTKQRQTELEEKFEWFFPQYGDCGSDEKGAERVLNQFATEGSVYCFIYDESFQIKYKSENTKELSGIYLKNIKKMCMNDTANTNYYTSSTSYPWIRLKGYFNIPSRYMSLSIPIVDFDGLEYGSNEYFVVVTKEVYTGENYSVFKEYSFYLFVFAVIMAGILGAIFSRIVTRPIIKIRDSAIRMANMDFTHKCEYKTDNEIGDLAKSLNFLSEKLNDTISQLEKANTNLKKDLDVQREIDQLRKEFIGSVSHEFKTPLTLIRGFTEMISDKRVEENEMQEAQSIIMEEVDRMDKLVQDLLELSKLQSATCELEEQIFDCTKLLHKSADKLSVMMREHNINFECELCEEAVWTKATQHRIEQVILNFMTNAVFNTKENGKVILKSEIQKDVIYISVFNEGSPIDETQIEKIWERFYRTDQSRSKKTGGTGLGLAICKEVLEKHKSLYGVENIDDGVQFYFTLQIHKK